MHKQIEFLLLLLFSIFISSCSVPAHEPFDISSVKTYTDIPGITQEEIDAIEELKKSGTPLIYASSRSTELFENQDGTLGGYTVLFCDWLSELFGIRFQPEIQGLSAMLANLRNCDICFATLSDTPERRQHYFVTDPIAQRSVLMLRMEGSQPIDRIRQDRLPRFVFTQGSVLLDIVTDALGSGSFETIIAANEYEVYQALKDGLADAFIATNNMEAAFDNLGGIYTEDFYPLVFLPAAMTAEYPEYEPIISVVTKAIKNGAYDHLTKLYKQGEKEYKKQKFLLQLTDEEKAYIQNNPIIPFVSQYLTYPSSFYNKDNGKWEGICFDLLDELEQLTGLVFEIVNDNSTDMPELLMMLDNGTAYCMPHMIQTDDRRVRFTLGQTIYIKDKFALLSKQSYPNIDLNDIPYEKVGYARASSFSEVFQRWFPNALYAREYPNMDDAFIAMERGEVNHVIASQNWLSALTNYYEFSDYKANYIFDAALDTSFGYNKDQTVLRSIIDKALLQINTEKIVDQWVSRTYNFEAIRLRQQRTLLIGAFVFSLIALVSILTMFINIYKKRKTISILLEKTRKVSDYEMMKHGLTIKAMNVGLWDKEISGEPDDNANPFDSGSHFQFSKEFRQMLGYSYEEEFPNVFSSCFNSIHPDDREHFIFELQEHLKDQTGKTPFDIELRLKMKNGEYRYFSLYGETLRDETGVPLRIAGAIKDKTEEKQTALEIEHNRRLVSTVNDAAVFLLNTDIDFFENALHLGMKVIARAVDVDRMYIWKNHIVNGELYCTQVYEWSEGAEPQQGNEYTVDIPYSKNIQGLEKLLSGDRCLNGIVREMSPGYQAQLVPQGIVSILIVPVFLKNEFWGFVGIDDCRNERIFTGQEEVILRSASLLFAHAYHRNEMLQTIRETSMQLKKAMEEVSEANKLKQTTINSLENILNNIDALLYVTVPETGKLLFVNTVFKKFLGRENDNLVGEYCYKAFRNLDEMCEFCPCYKLNENPEQNIVWEEYFEDMDRYVLHSDCYIDWPSGEKVHLQNAIDITDLTQRKAGEEKAKAESEAKTRFLAVMSHEIRTPMNVIMGSTESLLEKDSHSKETKDVLEKIYSSGNMLLSIINDILDLSKIEANKFEIIPLKYEVPSLINDTIHLNIMKYRQKDIRLNLQVNENLPLFLFGDELRIKQIINNLLSNAFKYTDSGEITVEFFPEDITPEKITLVIRVSDTGQGMTSEQVNLLFSEYTRFNMETNRTTTGTGLGLVITKNLTKLMNGEIEVESTPGKGSVFTTRIPQGVADSRLLGRETADNFKNGQFSDNVRKKKAKIIREPMPYGKVLIVDDMRSNIDVAVLLLTPYQLQIDTAESGYEAIDIIKNGKVYDIIFMDHMMPRMDGIETVKILRETGYTGTIVALTANAIVGQAEMFMENGFNGYLSKPIDQRELNTILNEFIRNRKSP